MRSKALGTLGNWNSERSWVSELHFTVGALGHLDIWRVLKNLRSTCGALGNLRHLGIETLETLGHLTNLKNILALEAHEGRLSIWTFEALRCLRHLQHMRERHLADPVYCNFEQISTEFHDRVFQTTTFLVLLETC